MTDSSKWFRSGNLLALHNTALVVIDAQQKLLPVIHEAERVHKRIQLMIRGCNVLSIPVVVTQQYPKGLGDTSNEVQMLLESSDIVAREDKTMFSCRSCDDAFASLQQRGIENLILVGIETHICVAQSAMDLMANGFETYVCVDAVGSRKTIDHDTALRRMENAGVVPTTVEAVLFELCEDANHESFKAISTAIR